MTPIKELVEIYKDTDPENDDVYWDDPETGSEGWIVFNSLRGGAAGGGTRMGRNVTYDEVKSLAKTMELKFTVAGPSIGGAKSGIRVNFDPADDKNEENVKKKKRVLERWFEFISPHLQNYYGTGGDMNVDDDEVIKYTSPYVSDPQEGIVVGRKRGNVEKILEQLRTGVSLNLYDPRFTPNGSGTYKINAMITGYGVVESLRHYYRLFTSNGSLSGKRAIVQGWGAVGAAAGYFLAKNGARIVAISDKDGYVLSNDGLGFEEVGKMFSTAKTFEHKDKIREESTEAIYDVEADIFVPSAGSFVKKEHVEQLVANGVEVIACGANVPFFDQGGGNIYSDITSYADQNLSVIPDFIANCGMAHTFAYLMQDGVSIDEEGIFNSVSDTIEKALGEIKDHFGASRLKLTEYAIRIALGKLGYE
jgi:glutamate dehydrogenase/leucine dehydrogenase